MASMNTRLNIEKLDRNIVQKHGGSKQVGFKQLGPGVKTGVHRVHNEKRVWFKVEMHGAQGDRKAEVFQVSNDDTTVAQRRLEDKQPEEKTNTDCLVKEHEKEYQTRSPSLAIGFKKPIDMLGFFGWLVSIKKGVLEPVKVKCIFLGYHKSIVGNKLWRLDEVTSKVVLYRNMGFNESGEYKKTFIGSGVARDKEQDSTHRLFSYREDSNEAAFAVAKAEKIYAHESLTFNNTVACEVISKWKAGLKDDMDARSDVYVLSNGCKKCSNDIDVYYWEYTPVQVLQRKVGTDFVEGTLHTVLEGSLSGTVMWKRMTHVQVFVNFDYAMGRSIIVMGRSITRYGLMIQGCTGSLEAMMLHMMALLPTEAGYMTLTKAVKEASDPCSEVPTMVEVVVYRRRLI
ncbi:hypothetical protein Tco_0918128 [Tanacetum coccineum]